MNIEEKILDIAKSLNEKKFNRLISFILNKNLNTKKYICEIIFKKIDSELMTQNPNENYLRTLISVPIELAIKEQIDTKNILQNSETFSDFISSHLLARSNVPNQSLRLAMSVFYSHIVDQPVWKKQKILERFGENILNLIFQIYTAKNEKSPMALSFLFENFESFLSLSPDLASMTNSFLKKLMLQKASDFVSFISQYRIFLQKKQSSAEFFVIHMSFLIKHIFELNHETLMGYMLKEFIEYVYGVKEESTKVEKNFQILCKILLQSKNLIAHSIACSIQLSITNHQKVSCAQLFKQINLKNSEIITNTNNKTLSKLSPFQKIALLHKDA